MEADPSTTLDLAGSNQFLLWLNGYTILLKVVSCPFPLSVEILLILSLSLVAKLCPTLVTWAIACQDPLSMGFSRQKYWNGFPFPSPDLTH